MPPYWPWVQAIRSYVRERDPEQLRSEMGAGAADIAEVVSDVKDRLPVLKPPPNPQDAVAYRTKELTIQVKPNRGAIVIVNRTLPGELKGITNLK